MLSSRTRPLLVHHPHTGFGDSSGEIIMFMFGVEPMYAAPKAIDMEPTVAGQLHSASMIIHMSWAQIRLAAYSQGSRPSAEVPETSI